uniref:Uncharacterized protein n=1 Tax=viral metagenome TaxID=1070528 RepID=A0A2V0RBR5_9ZZZZ
MMIEALKLVARINWFFQMILERMREIGPWMDGGNYAEVGDTACSEYERGLLHNNFMGYLRKSMTCQLRDIMDLDYEIINMALVPWAVDFTQPREWRLRFRSYNFVHDDRHVWYVHEVVGSNLSDLKQLMQLLISNIKPVQWRFDGCGERTRHLGIYCLRTEHMDDVSPVDLVSSVCQKLNVAVINSHYSTVNRFGMPHMPISDVANFGCTHPDSSWPEFWRAVSVIDYTRTKQHWKRYTPSGGANLGQEE